MAADRKQRRQIIVDAEMQVGISMHLVVFLYVYFLMFAIAVNAPAFWNVIAGDGASPEYAEGVARLRGFVRFTGIPLALTFLCMAVHGVYFTHRIAGPVFRFKETLRAWARRAPPRAVKLREKDYMKDLADEFSKTLEVVREDEARKRRMNADTVRAARDLLEATESGDASPEDLLAHAHTILDTAERLERHLIDGSDDPASIPVADGEPEPVLAPTDG